MSGGARSEDPRRDPQRFPVASGAKAQPFRVEAHRDGDTTIVAPVGELDLGTIEDLEAALRQALDGGCRDLVLDLRRLSFLDSSGLHLVVRWNAITEEYGAKFVVIQGGPRIRRLFEIVGLVDGLPFVEAAANGHTASA